MKHKLRWNLEKGKRATRRKGNSLSVPCEMIRRSPAVSQLQRERDVTVSCKQQVSFRPRIMRDPSMLYNMRKYLVTFRFPVIETNARWLGSLKSSCSLGYLASRQFIGVTSVIRSRFNKPAAMGELNATKLDTRISSALLFRAFSLPLKKFSTLDARLKNRN